MRPLAWPSWLNRHADSPRPRVTHLPDHHFLMIEAVLEGLGVAMAPMAIAAGDARLDVPRGFDADGTDYGLIHPSGAAVSDDLAASITRWIALPEQD